MDSDDSDNIPGPGSYDIVKPARSNNGISFGKSEKEPSYWKIEKSPGPGSYNIQDDRNRFRRGFQYRYCGYRWGRSNGVPGPGAYNIPKVDLIHKKAPKYSIRPALNRFCEDN